MPVWWRALLQLLQVVSKERKILSPDLNCVRENSAEPRVLQRLTARLLPSSIPNYNLTPLLLPSHQSYYACRLLPAHCYALADCVIFSIASTSAATP